MCMGFWCIFCCCCFVKCVCVCVIVRFSWMLTHEKKIMYSSAFNSTHFIIWVVIEKYLTIICIRWLCICVSIWSNIFNPLRYYSEFNVRNVIRQDRRKKMRSILRWSGTFEVDFVCENYECVHYCCCCCCDCHTSKCVYWWWSYAVCVMKVTYELVCQFGIWK